jgi:hypothetical protein
LSDERVDERAELVERECPVGEAVQDVLDPVESGVVVGVGGLLPGLGALEGDAASGEQAAQGLAADAITRPCAFRR